MQVNDLRMLHRKKLNENLKMIVQDTLGMDKIQGLVYTILFAKIIDNIH